MISKCAKWCGAGCTQEEYDAATLAAESLADRLDKQLGGDWKVKVWENMGWYYSVESECGRLKIHPRRGGGYTAFLGRAHQPGGRWAEHGTTPRKSIKAVLNTAKKDLEGIGQFVTGLEQYL